MSYAVCVSFTLAPGTRDAFLPLILENARRSVADEPGCHRFDVCTDPDRPEAVFLYEIYEDIAAFDAHRGMPHYAIFDEAAAAMIADKQVTVYPQVGP